MVTRLWKGSPELVATAGVMAVVLVGALVGLAVDDRIVTGAPVWLKPATFAVSIAIYVLTVAWMFTRLPEWRRTRRIVGWATAAAMLIEMAIIGGQAWRGVVSHFNVGTPLDAVLFHVMGGVIVSQTIVSVMLAVALWRQSFGDAALGWALRLGMTLTIAGAFTGGLMARPTTVQLERAGRGEPLLVAGAHTVGAPDGGPGLAGTGWSRDHGDLRVPHFVGLHAIQVLPLVALGLGRRRVTDAARARLVVAAAASYGALYVTLLVQALRGLPAVPTDAAMALPYVAWALLTVVVVLLVLRVNSKGKTDRAAVSEGRQASPTSRWLRPRSRSRAGLLPRAGGRTRSRQAW